LHHTKEKGVNIMRWSLYINKAILGFLAVTAIFVTYGIIADSRMNSNSFMNDTDIDLAYRLDDSTDREVASFDEINVEEELIEIEENNSLYSEFDFTEVTTNGLNLDFDQELSVADEKSYAQTLVSKLWKVVEFTQGEKVLFPTKVDVSKNNELLYNIDLVGNRETGYRAVILENNNKYKVASYKKEGESESLTLYREVGEAYIVIIMTSAIEKKATRAVKKEVSPKVIQTRRVRGAQIVDGDYELTSYIVGGQFNAYYGPKILDSALLDTDKVDAELRGSLTILDGKISNLEIYISVNKANESEPVIIDFKTEDLNVGNGGVFYQEVEKIVGGVGIAGRITSNQLGGYILNIKTKDLKGISFSFYSQEGQRKFFDIKERTALNRSLNQDRVVNDINSAHKAIAKVRKVAKKKVQEEEDEYDFEEDDSEDSEEDEEESEERDEDSEEDEDEFDEDESEEENDDFSNAKVKEELSVEETKLIIARSGFSF
jgi:hypothetical protein